MISHKLVCLSFLLCTTLTEIHAQSLSLDWAVSTGGPDDYITPRAIRVDNSGNVINVGSFEGIADFDPGPGEFFLSSVDYDLTDIYVQKLDSNGDFLWAVSVGNLNTELGNSVAIDEDGNVYVTGVFVLPTDFDPGIGVSVLTPSGGLESFLLKLDPDGNFVWAIALGGAFTDSGDHLEFDEEGNLYLAGKFQGTVDFDPGPDVFNLSSSGGSEDVFIQKLDVDGNLIWAKGVGGPESDFLEHLTIDPFGNIVFCGRFYGTADFDPSASTFSYTSLGITDIFVEKIDSDGNFLWAKRIGTIDSDWTECLTTDSDGDITIVGYLNNTMDFDPGTDVYNLSTNGLYDLYVWQLDSDGNFGWAHSFGSELGDHAYAVAVDDLNNVYVSGSFTSDTIDFDPSSGILELTKGMYILILDENGFFYNALGIESAGARDMTFDDANNLHVLGGHYGTVDFDPSSAVYEISTSGTGNMFSLKFSQCTPSTGTDTQAVCDSLTWLNGVTYSVDNNTATYILENSLGCDSIVTLDLTITPLDIGVSQLDNVLYADMSDVNYQWINCADSSQIAGENDQSFTPEKNGDYAVIIDNGICSDTSECLTISGLNLDQKSLNCVLKISPNPASNIVQIIHCNPKKTTLKIYTMDGKVIYSNDSYLPGTPIDLSNLRLARGPYLLRLTNSDYDEIEKLVVK